MSFNGIIFDLDGTLLNTLDDLADSFNYALAQYQYPQHPLAAYRYFIGDGAQTAVERSLPPEARNEKTVRLVLSAFTEHYAKNYKNKSQPYPGIPALLESLKSRDIRMAVLSNKPHDFTVQCVQDYFDNYFIRVQGVESRFDKKPAPQSTLHILEQFKLPAEQALFVGDTKTDIHTAKNAGLKSAGVAWGFRGRVELEQAGADFIIEHPQKLAFIIG